MLLGRSVLAWEAAPHLRFERCQGSRASFDTSKINVRWFFSPTGTLYLLFALPR
ncbi:hypothetical protein D3C86_607000 [compost metagenome]